MKTYGIDVNALTRARKTGTERYVFELLKEMIKTPLQNEERVVLYSSALIPELGTLPNGWILKILDWKLKKAWTHARLSWELLTRTPDVFFSPAHEIPLFHRRTKFVSTVHDVAFRIVPEVYSKKSVKRQEWAVARALKLDQKIITISETSKNDLVNLYHVAPERIAITPLAVHPEAFATVEADKQNVLDKYRLNAGLYFVTVGRVEKKKNIPFLLSTFEAFKRDRGIGDPYQLVLAGTFGEDAKEIQAQIEKLVCKDVVRVLGYVPDAELPGLLAGAVAYVFPTRYEGFGIPALEAMASRIPLIASDIPALREVAGDAALFAGVEDAGAWIEAMQKIVDNESLRADLVLKGAQRLHDFSWVETAKKTWEVLRSV
ncbi:MAG: glycosyltransferase family 1 protein [Patescibacteria group bacterium]